MIRYGNNQCKNDRGAAFISTSRPRAGTGGLGKGRLPKECFLFPGRRASGPSAEDAADCHVDCGALSFPRAYVRPYARNPVPQEGVSGFFIFAEKKEGL